MVCISCDNVGSVVLSHSMIAEFNFCILTFLYCIILYEIEETSNLSKTSTFW